MEEQKMKQIKYLNTLNDYFKFYINNFINNQKILEYSDNNNYQISCQRYFEMSHKTEEIVPINHPNQYFEQSKRILNGNKTANKGPNIKIEHLKIEMTQ